MRIDKKAQRKPECIYECPFDFGEEAEVSSPAKEKKEHTSIKDRLKDGEAKKNAKLAEKADKVKPPKAKEALAV